MELYGAESRAMHKPALVLFTAGWCPTCRQLESEVLSQPGVQGEIQAHYAFVKVDLTRPNAADEAHAREFGVHAIPTLIRFDANGKKTGSANYLSAEDLVAWLKAGE